MNPVIDPSTGTPYVTAYTYENSLPVYRLHPLSTFADAVTPHLVTGSALLSNSIRKRSVKDACR